MQSDITKMQKDDDRMPVSPEYNDSTMVRFLGLLNLINSLHVVGAELCDDLIKGTITYLNKLLPRGN